jgi:glyoxylase-like metal-dependent hydrolase (beta-lactamase superfamily II)
MGDFVEVGDRVWVARHEWWDLNIAVIAGDRGLLVVDTHASEVAARRVIAGIRRLGAGRVVGIVNTHEHFDHTFGNAVFRDVDPALPIHAHEVAAERTVQAGERIQAEYARHPEDVRAAEVMETRIVPADQVFSTSRTIDLGDREVELSYHGRAHTGGDAVVHVPDADVLVVGDLIEESAPPVHGPDSFPLDWPATVAGVEASLTGRSVVVPGHGAVVDRDFVRRQARDLARVAATIRERHATGVPAEVALQSTEWPWDTRVLGYAVERGYEQLRWSTLWMGEGSG